MVLKAAREPAVVVHGPRPTGVQRLHARQGGYCCAGAQRSF
jgi:hypothetical protein